MQLLRALLVVFIFSLAAPLAQAQIELRPLTAESASSRHLRTTEDSTVIDTLTLQLPFFEDFAAYTGQPDTNKFLPSGGVYVNRDWAIGPPSKHSATFDALNADGYPYDNVQATRQGTADTLISHFIDLSGEAPENQILFSFYWQVQGFGEKPDISDYLSLEFRDAAGEWREMWQEYGPREVAQKDSFQLVVVDLQNEDFFHEKFQFRFVNRGRLSGQFDVWHLDYLYLDRDRDPARPYLLDIACSQMQTQYLRPYSAMPLAHFVRDTVGFRQDTLRATLNNLNDNFNVINYQTSVELLPSKQLLTQFIDTSMIIEALASQYELISPAYADFVPQDADSLHFRTAYWVKTDEPDSLGPGIYTRTNDTIWQETILKDFYAYDDGTAEFAAGINQKFGQLAYRFVVHEESELSHIDLHFAPVGNSLLGETFNLLVWKSLDFSLTAPEDEVLYAENLPVQYAEGRNQFLRLRLDERIAVTDTFYIGIQQLAENMLPLGLDRNTDSGAEMFYNVANFWQQNESLRGSLMLRPVFAAEDPNALEREPNSPENQLRPYPNPTSADVHLPGQWDQVQLVDLFGRVLFEANQPDENLRIPLSARPSGLYLVRALRDGVWQQARVIRE